MPPAPTTTPRPQCLIYDDVDPAGGTTITWTMDGEIVTPPSYNGQYSSADLAAAILEAERVNAVELIIRINSPGGDLIEGLAMYDMLRAATVPTRAEIWGDCCSSATLVALGCDTIAMSPSSRWMIHEPMGAASGTLAEQRQYADSMAIERDKLIDIYTRHTGQDRDAIIAALTPPTFFTAAQALAGGWIDTIINPTTGPTAYNPHRIVAMDPDHTRKPCAADTATDPDTEKPTDPTPIPAPGTATPTAASETDPAEPDKSTTPTAQDDPTAPAPPPEQPDDPTDEDDPLDPAHPHHPAPHHPQAPQPPPAPHARLALLRYRCAQLRRQLASVKRRLAASREYAHRLQLEAAARSTRPTAAGNYQRPAARTDSLPAPERPRITDQATRISQATGACLAAGGDLGACLAAIATAKSAH